MVADSRDGAVGLMFRFLVCLPLQSRVKYLMNYCVDCLEMLNVWMFVIPRGCSSTATTEVDISSFK